jgi:hypothetical protein
MDEPAAMRGRLSIRSGSGGRGRRGPLTPGAAARLGVMIGVLVFWEIRQAG